jgi:hypothetical protein
MKKNTQQPERAVDVGSTCLVSTPPLQGLIDTTKLDEITLVKSVECRHVGFKNATVILARQKGESRKHLIARAMKELNDIKLDFPRSTPKRRANKEVSE